MPRPADMPVLRALRHRPFAQLWLGQTVSAVGDFLFQIALTWWVLEQGGSAVTVSLVLLASFAPTAILSLAGGVVVDRLPRVPVLLASDLARGLATAIMALLAWGGRLEVWQVLALNVLFGVADAFFRPAYMALVPQITPADRLNSANSLTSIGFQLGRVLGPGLGAAAVALGGTTLAFALNSASFLFAAAMLLPLLGRYPAATPEAGAGRGPLADLRAGWATVTASPVLLLAILVPALAISGLVGPFNVAIPVLVKQEMQRDVATLGLLLAVFPIGYILGGLYLGRLSRLRHRGPAMFLGVAVAGLMLALFGLRPPLPVLLLAALINGFALEVFQMTWISAYQELVPVDRMGRVASVDLLVSSLLMGAGYGLAGMATDLSRASLVLLAGGLFAAVTALLALIHPVVRRFD